MTWTGFAPPQPYNLEVDFATATPWSEKEDVRAPAHPHP